MCKGCVSNKTDIAQASSIREESRSTVATFETEQSVVQQGNAMANEHSDCEMATCTDCGGRNVPSGNTKTARSKRPSFGCYVGNQVELVEYRCESCGYETWSQERRAAVRL
jgi:hypothetical protein